MKSLNDILGTGDLTLNGKTYQLKRMDLLSLSKMFEADLKTEQRTRLREEADAFGLEGPDRVAYLRDAMNSPQEKITMENAFDRMASLEGVQKVIRYALEKSGWVANEEDIAELFVLSRLEELQELLSFIIGVDVSIEPKEATSSTEKKLSSSSPSSTGSTSSDTCAPSMDVGLQKSDA